MIDKLLELKKQEKIIKKLIDEENKKILEHFNSNEKINFLENDNGKISYVNGSESISLDITKIKKQESELYNELLDAYPKVTKRSPFLRVVLKWKKNHLKIKLKNF